MSKMRPQRYLGYVVVLVTTLLLPSGDGYVPGYANSEYDAPTRYDYGNQYQQQAMQRHQQQQLQQQRQQEGEQRGRYSGGGGGGGQRGQPQYTRISPPDPSLDIDQGQARRRQYQIRAHESIANREQHKCRIWVPTETVSKYPQKNLIQTDLSNQLSMIELCCTGYWPTRLKGVTICRPICGCSNGSCRYPGGCDCYEGFVKNDNGDCVFTCPLGCQNGHCYLDGSCECDPGYMLDETRKFCRPICSLGCDPNLRYNCTAPEMCTCAKGTRLAAGSCQPICDPDCGVGGRCLENNECDCGAGYTLRDGVCQSDCYQNCSNGVCVSRNRCICDPGFTYHERSTMCVPL